MFQVGYILMNFTTILLFQDRCSMPAERFMVEHFFCKRGLFLVTFCYIHIPSIIYLTFQSIFDIVHSQDFFFRDKGLPFS